MEVYKYITRPTGTQARESPRDAIQSGDRVPFFPNSGAGAWVEW